MLIKVRLFASLKDIVGQPEIDIKVRENATPRSVFHELRIRFPELTRYEPTILVAVNQEYADWCTRVAAGDEVVFFPPVSGGK